MDEEKEVLDNSLKKETSLIESKMRMLDDYNQKVEQLKSQLEKARFDVKQYNFIEVETKLDNPGFGDTFFMKRKQLI